MYLVRVGQPGFISKSRLQDEKAGMLFKRMIIGWLVGVIIGSSCIPYPERCLSRKYEGQRSVCICKIG